MNLFDYLDWRGDVPFSVDPFNEVDNLLLSQLVYTEFEGIGLDGKTVSMQATGNGRTALAIIPSAMLRSSMLRHAIFRISLRVT